MHIKGDMYYHVTTTLPRKWTKLSKDLQEAKVKWAELEGVTDDSGLFSALVRRYLDECLNDKAENTRKQYTIQAAVLQDVFGTIPIKSITPPMIADYLDSHKSKTSANNEIALLSTMFEKALRWGWCDRNPVKGIRRNYVKQRDRYITDEEFDNLRASLPDYIQCMMDICILTAARVTDIINIKMQDVTPSGLYITQMKTGNRQQYDISPELRSVIDTAKGLAKDRRVRSMHLICNKQGKQVRYETFREKFKAACVAMGIPNTHFHDIRAKSATDFYSEGGNHQKLLGHKNRATSDRYVKARAIDTVTPHSRKKKTG
jgi:integrase